MTANQSKRDLFEWDEIDDRLARCEETSPPDELRSVILSEIPTEALTVASSSDAAKSATTRRTLLGNRRLRYAVAASAATLAFVIFFLSRTETPAEAEPWDLLVAAAEASGKVEALHITNIFRYEHKSLEKKAGVEHSWWLRNVGFARVARNREGEVIHAIAQRHGLEEKYNGNTNEFVIEPIVGNSGDFAPPPNWFDLDNEYNFAGGIFKQAKKLDIPIDVTELEIDGRKVKRMSVHDVKFGGPEVLNEHIYSSSVEIDVATNHIIRTRTEDREVRKPGSEKYFGKDDVPKDSVHEFLFDYPDPSRFDLSVFTLPIPADAIVIRLEYPAWMLKERDQLMVIGVFIGQYLRQASRKWYETNEGVSDISYPENFLETLSEMENFPVEYLYAWDSMRGMDKTRPKWTFFHAGDKLNDLIKEGELLSTTQMYTVIAEKRYDSGHVLQLFADGDVRITPPHTGDDADSDK